MSALAVLQRSKSNNIQFSFIVTLPEKANYPVYPVINQEPRHRKTSIDQSVKDSRQDKDKHNIQNIVKRISAQIPESLTLTLHESQSFQSQDVKKTHRPTIFGIAAPNPSPPPSKYVPCKSRIASTSTQPKAEQSMYFRLKTKGSSG